MSLLGTEVYKPQSRHRNEGDLDCFRHARIAETHDGIMPTVAREGLIQTVVAHRGMRSEQACGCDHDDCGEIGEQQQVIQDTDGHRSPLCSTILAAHPNTLTKK